MPSSSAERAAFATTARLLSCLVTESLVPAVFIPLKSSHCVGIAVLLTPHTSTIPAHKPRYYTQEDVLAIILLRGVPILKSDSDGPCGKKIGLLDPLDMFPLVLVSSIDGHSDENEVWPLRLYPISFPFSFSLPTANST